jgi:molybdopterin-guanine dinucleotide biosynthesis protein A
VSGSSRDRPTGSRATTAITEATPTPEEIAAGIVLAGGRSSRFGGDKLAAVERGMPVLHHAVLRLLEVCDEVVIVLAPDAPEPVLPPGVPARFVRDAADGEGPLAGMLAGLGATRAGLAVVAGGDMPELATSVVLEMLAVAGRDGRVEAVALQDGDRVAPLPIVVRVERGRHVAHALLHEGERSLHRFLDAVRVAVIDEQTWRRSDPERRTLRDVDVPGDLHP